MKIAKKVLKTIGTLFKEYRPFAFFSCVAVVLWLLALVFFVPVFVDFLQTGEVLRFPTLIVSGITALIGTLLWVCGILLEVIAKKHRQMYEMWLTHLSM